MRFLVLCAAMVVGACSGSALDQTNVPEADRKIFGRTDCRRLADDKKLEIEFARAEAVCVNRATAAAATGSAPIRSYRPSMAAAISDGIEQGMTERRIAEATVVSCMAEHGYLWRTRAEHEAVCR